MESGVCLVHKETGGTSFDVVRAFSREAREEGLKKYPLGHGGTLDPFASGLLLILAGQATRLMELMHPLPKTYVAVLAWGAETDTCDHLGRPMAEGDASALSPAMLDAALAAFLGWRDQVPPATSAKKIDGEAAYRKAHRGEEVLLPPSRVYLHEARWLDHDLPKRSRLELTCRGGYYVRALARDLGRQLGCGAHLAGLDRSAIGPWSDPAPGAREWVRGEALVPWCRSRWLTGDEAASLGHGRAIPLGEMEEPTWKLPAGFPDPVAPIRALHEGRLVALLREQEGGLRTFANLRGGL
ncbi:MAG: tRNA pseudouridine(55) synthase TruB [Holophagaceae bacterium]|nr:tRNA pseudouridine(55) synthase TruB [Holophagaceae bacterium]